MQCIPLHPLRCKCAPDDNQWILYRFHQPKRWSVSSIVHHYDLGSLHVHAHHDFLHDLMRSKLKFAHNLISWLTRRFQLDQSSKSGCDLVRKHLEAFIDFIHFLRTFAQRITCTEYGGVFLHGTLHIIADFRGWRATVRIADASKRSNAFFKPVTGISGWVAPATKVSTQRLAAAR